MEEDMLHLCAPLPCRCFARASSVGGQGQGEGRGGQCARHRSRLPARVSACAQLPARSMFQCADTDKNAKLSYTEVLCLVNVATWVHFPARGSSANLRLVLCEDKNMFTPHGWQPCP